MRYSMIRFGAMAMVAVAIVFCTGCSERRSAQFAEQGNTYLILGDVEEASAAFDRALAANPKNADAKLGQARCLWFKKEAEPALSAYREAIVLNPALDKAYMEAAKAAISLGDVATAETIAKQYEAVKPDAGGMLRAFVLRETDRVSEAISVLTQLREKFPKSEEVRVNLAAALIAAKKPAEAESELKKSLEELNATSLPTRMLLVEAYQEQGKLAEIEAELRTLAQQRPDEPSLQLSLARTLVAGKKFEEAEAIARPILEKTPESPWANFVIGACLLEQGKYGDALNCLQAAAGALPNDQQIAKLLALAQSGGTAPQTATVSTAPASGDGKSEERTWQTLWRNASLRELLRDRDTFLATGEANCAETIALAAVFAQEVPLAKRLAEQLPAESPVATYINALLTRDGKALRTALDEWRETAADRRLLRMNAEGFALAVTGARAQALRVYSQSLQEFPENGVTYYNVASMFRGAGMPKFAIGTLKQLISRHSENHEARKLLFDTMVDAGLTDDARRQAESTFALFPTEPESLISLSRVYREAGEVSLAEDVLRKGLERMPDKPQLTIALVELLLARGQVGDAAEILKSIENDSAWKQQVALLGGHIAAAQNEWPEAVSRCAAAAGPSYPLPTRLLHAAALIKTGDTKGAGDALREADGRPRTGPSTNVLLRALDVTTEPLPDDQESLVAPLKSNADALGFFAYGMACREMRFSASAYTMFRTVDEKIENQSYLVELALSAVARASGLPERVEIARHFTEKYPDMAAAWIGMADVQSALGDTTAQLASLEQASKVDPANDAPWRRLVQFHSDRGDYASLLEVCRQLAAILPDDAYVANNLAYCLLQTNGNIDEALALAQAAYHKLPNNSEVMHTLGLAQMRKGDLDDGGKNLTAALEMRPGDPTLLLDYGQLLMQQNKTEEGKTHIQLALRYANQLGIEFPRRTEAEEAVAQGNS